MAIFRIAIHVSLLLTQAAQENPNKDQLKEFLIIFIMKFPYISQLSESANVKAFGEICSARMRSRRFRVTSHCWAAHTSWRQAPIDFRRILYWYVQGLILVWHQIVHLSSSFMFSLSFKMSSLLPSWRYCRWCSRVAHYDLRSCTTQQEMGQRWKLIGSDWQTAVLIYSSRLYHWLFVPKSLGIPKLSTNQESLGPCIHFISWIALCHPKALMAALQLTTLGDGMEQISDKATGHWAEAQEFKRLVYVIGLGRLSCAGTPQNGKGKNFTAHFFWCP